MFTKFSNILSICCIATLLLWNICEASPSSRRHVRISRSIEETESKLSEKDIDKKLYALKHKKRELLKYKRILEDLNEIMTEYDDSEYVDLSQNEIHHEDLLEILKYLEELGKESQNNHYRNKSPIHAIIEEKITNKDNSGKNSNSLKSENIVKYEDYDPSEMQSDMPGRNDLDSGEENDRDSKSTNGNLSPSILEKFNLTREDLLALSTKMQNNGKSGSSTRIGNNFFPTNQATDIEATQQDSSITMSPQQLGEIFNLTVNGDGKVQYDRNLSEDEMAKRAKQLALQHIKKSMLTYFVHSGTQTTSKVADQTQLERERPGNLNRKPVQPRHAISEAHRAFLSHAQQMQDQPSDMTSFRNNIADTDILSSTFTEKNIAFHPRCELPKNTDSESWNDSNTLNLLFNVSSAMKTERPNFTLASATLRLYKVSPDFGNIKRTTGDDDQIRISVSWYTRSLKKHRVKRKLSDSKMVPSTFTGWIELNLKSAVSSWKTTTRNHGIAISVEDQEGNALRANTYIQNQDCANLHPKPLPWILHKKLPSNDGDVSYRFPRLDLSTRELANYNYQGIPSFVNTFHSAPSAYQAVLSSKD